MQLIRTRPPKLSAARRSLLRFQRCSRYFEKLISHCQCRWQLLLSASLANVAFLNDVPCHSHHVRIPAREAVLLLLGCSDYGVDGEAWRLCSGILFVLWRQTVASDCGVNSCLGTGTPQHLLAIQCVKQRSERLCSPCLVCFTLQQPCQSGPHILHYPH